MTNNIYPPDHLLRKWESLIIDEEENVDVVLYEAFQAGADHELEACCADLRMVLGPDQAAWLGSVRRPKPLSLEDRKEESSAEPEYHPNLWSAFQGMCKELF